MKIVRMIIMGRVVKKNLQNDPIILVENGYGREGKKK